jgi:hypothetical protein
MPMAKRGHGGGAVVVCVWLVACGGPAPTNPSGPSAADGGLGTDQTHPDAATGAMIDAAIPSFPLGVFDCTSALEEFHSSASGNGTLTITQTGSVLTTTYTGDYCAQGALEFVATTDSTANPVASGQTLGVIACSFSSSLTLGQESVTSGSMTMDAQTLFLSVVGTLANSNASADCPAQQSVTLSLVCTKG